MRKIIAAELQTAYDGKEFGRFEKEVAVNPKKDTQKSAQGLSAEERAALKETLRERKAAASREGMEKAALEAIAKMKDPNDRAMAKRIHEIVTAAAPHLLPRTWYGMPAYATPEGKVICFFQAASKFGVRYATFGFQPDAKLDDGNMWPASFALVKLTAAEEKKIEALVKKAVR